MPTTTKAATSRYRAINDPSSQTQKRFLLLDTPGHGKLRYHALHDILELQNLAGIIFVVDAANLSRGGIGLVDAAEYMYEILLSLQNRSRISKGNSSREMPVLIAANKLDLFTALPAPLVKAAIASEITNIRILRAKGLSDSGINGNSAELHHENEWLGDASEDSFDFSQMAEANITVTAAEGFITSSGGADVSKWWDWIGGCL